MKSFIFLALFLLPVSSVDAQIDSKIHNICLDAKDYAGCIKVNNKKERSTFDKFFKKEKTIFDGLSKKEKNFLEEYIINYEYGGVSSNNGNWEEISKPTKWESYRNFVNTKSIKRVGKLVSFKSCFFDKTLPVDKQICDKKIIGLIDNKIGGNSPNIIDCKRELIFSEEIEAINPSLTRPQKWEPLPMGSLMAIANIACRK